MAFKEHVDSTQSFPDLNAMIHGRVRQRSFVSLQLYQSRNADLKITIEIREIEYQPSKNLNGKHE